MSAMVSVVISALVSLHNSIRREHSHFSSNTHSGVMWRPPVRMLPRNRICTSRERADCKPDKEGYGQRSEKSFGGVLDLFDVMLWSKQGLGRCPRLCLQYCRP